MVYRFTIISDEVDNFRREIQIDSDATFLDFHNAILKSVGYPNDQMTSFFVCDDNWEKETEVTLEDMGTSSDVDSWIMEETPLSELLEEEKQHLLYIFDPLADRAFWPSFAVWPISQAMLPASIISPFVSRLPTS